MRNKFFWINLTSTNVLEPFGSTRIRVVCLNVFGVVSQRMPDVFVSRFLTLCCFLNLLLVLPGTLAAQNEGPMLKVIVDSAPIQINKEGVNQRVGMVTRYQRVFALKTKGDFFQVKVPENDRIGWIWKSHVEEALYAGMEQINSTEQKAVGLFNEGKYTEALPVFNQLLQLKQEAYKDRHPRLATCMRYIAACHTKLKNYSESTKHFVKAENILLQWFPNTHEYVLLTQTLRCQNAVLAGDYDDAESELRELLRVSIEEQGESSSTTARIMTSLAYVYSSRGKNDEAMQWYQRAIPPDADRSPSGRLNAAELLMRIGSIHENDYRYVEAKEHFSRAYEIRKENLGEENISTVEANIAIGGVEKELGQFVKAKERLRRIYEQLTETDVSNRFMFNLLMDLGFVYESLGDQSNAEFYLKKCHELDKDLNGEDSLKVMNSLHNLGFFYFKAGRYDEAESIHLKTLRIRMDEYGESHNQTIASLWSLGEVYRQTGDFEKAEDYHLRVLKAAKEIDDPNFQDPMNLADLYYTRGRLEDAEKLIQESIQLWKKKRRPLLGHRHHLLASIYAAGKQLNNTLIALDESRQLVTRHIANVLPGMQPRGRTAYLNDTFTPDLEESISMALLQADDPRSASLSAGWIVNGKSIAQEIVAEAALLGSPEAEKFVVELRGVRGEIAGLNLAQKSDLQSQKRLAELESRQQSLESKLTEFGSGRFSGDTWVSVGALMSKLPLDTRFITFAKIRVRNFDVRRKDDQNAWRDSRYVAWIIPPLGTGAVKIVDLGPSNQIDEDISKLRRFFGANSSMHVQSNGELESEGKYRKSAEKLSAKLFHPLEPYLDGAGRIVLSPDGELWTLAWDALLTKDGQYLIEKFNTRYVMTGRDLARPVRKRGLIGNPVIFADPNYDFNSSKTTPINSTTRSPIAGTRFSRLVNSAAEAASIRPSLESFVGKTSQVFLEDKAQEATFKSLHRPSVIVLSTHGFFHSSDEASGEALVRSGLALAGANSASGEGGEDGILTGLEIVGTDLRGTGLVVLSACETGLGDIRNGEGVAGLRQAFQMAGAESVLASLWQVDDAETARLMNLFFKNLANGMAKSEALRQAQLTRIKARRARHGAAHPFFWAAFTLTGQD